MRRILRASFRLLRQVAGIVRYSGLRGKRRAFRIVRRFEPDGCRYVPRLVSGIARRLALGAFRCVLWLRLLP